MTQAQKYIPLKDFLEWNIEYRLGLTTLTVKKGEVFLEKGNRCDYLYFVLKGFVRIHYYDIEGNDMTHLFAFQNSIITSPFSFF
ncbi:MAG: cyclic nucleotide-binding domain-containing protein [Flavobacteriales bacterium]|jgi:CRP-like cAMP-binding protein|nr:cyclic nucleotide-binding domain-containing protein [Flavobacteriales bacterium]